MNTIEMVHQFHKAFERPIATNPDISNWNLNELRLRLLREEVNELEDAIENQDKVKVLDALTDIQYILDGTYLSFGMHNLKDIAFCLVHHSNMLKLGKDGKPIVREDGKILKPEGWQPPDLSALV
jgi:predicted HAD superfamily Cof-like phosphohydrolase